MSVALLDPRAVSIVPCDAALGATVTGVDLRAPLSATDLGRLRTGIDRHLVLFSRDQLLDDATHVALASQLGRVLPHPIASLRGESGPVTVVRNDERRKPGNAAWHSDLSWLEEPPGLAVLRSVQIPERGGDTIWADMHAAWEALSAPWQRRVRHLRAVHDFDRAVGPRLRRIDGQVGHRRVREAFPPAIHPIVRVRPTSGHLALFVNEAFTSEIVGVSRAESDEIIGELFAHVRKPRWQVRHRWREGDVVIWDERVTQHFASADHYPAEREVRRVTIAGERPV